MCLAENKPYPVVALADLLLLAVELVLNIADDLLENILHRYYARRLSVFVYYDGHMHVLVLHLMKQIVDVQSVGNQKRLP